MSTYSTTKILNPGKGYPCAFRNWRAQSHCNQLHGYDLIFSITFECDENSLSKEGHVVDFGAFGPLKERIEETFDHRTIVAEDDPNLNWYRDGSEKGVLTLTILPDVSCEAFATWLAVEAQKTLVFMGRDNDVNITKAQVWEQGSNGAAFLPE